MELKLALGRIAGNPFGNPAILAILRTLARYMSIL
jgi:hypothetical protein